MLVENPNNKKDNSQIKFFSCPYCKDKTEVYFCQDCDKEIIDICLECHIEIIHKHIIVGDNNMKLGGNGCPYPEEDAQFFPGICDKWRDA